MNVMLGLPESWVSARRPCSLEAGAPGGGRMTINRLADRGRRRRCRAGRRTPCLRSARLSEVLGAEITLKLETPSNTAPRSRTAARWSSSRASRPRSRPRRDRDVGRQPCPGGRLPRDPARHPRPIVMPKITPFSKVETTEALGAKVLLARRIVDESADYAHARGRARAGLHAPLRRPPRSSRARARSASRCSRTRPNSRRWWFRSAAAG